LPVSAIRGFFKKLTPNTAQDGSEEQAKLDVMAISELDSKNSDALVEDIPAVGTRQNGVLVGHDGILFLSGGSHTVFDIVMGLKPIPSQCFTVFAENLAARAAWARQHDAKYLHVIFPDKQSIIPEQWPDGVPLRMGEEFVKRTPGGDQLIFYPVALLEPHKADVISKVDTHINGYGSILIAAELVRRLTGEAQDEIAARLVGTLVMGEPKGGDLGSKLDPPVMGRDLVSSARSPGKWVSNEIQGGNNGLVDLRLNAHAPYDKRVVFFGDSFGRDVCRFLQFWFREVIFLRSGYFHPEVADLCPPDYLVTENVERYLDNCLPDAGRPNFFMYPFLNRLDYAPSQEFAAAFSALLSGNQPPYKEFYVKEFNRGVPVSKPSPEDLSAIFRMNKLPLVDWPEDADRITPSEKPEIVARRMPEFWLDLSGKNIQNALGPTQDIHGSNIVQRQGVLLFGPNLQVDAAGRWACESRAFTAQFLDAFVTDSFQTMFPGPKPTLLREDGKFSLYLGDLDQTRVQIIEEPVFLATPLEPSNWGRWVATVLPKLSQFKLYGKGRKLFCYTRLEWQRALFMRFGLSADMILYHDPGCTYFCKDLMTVDYNVTNMTISRSEKVIFAGIVEESIRRLSNKGLLEKRRKVFVSRLSASRRHPTYRRLVNEEELIEALTAIGFSTLETETLDFDEQVATFANAEIVVCLGGAALYNAVFCKANAVVITIESSGTFLQPHTTLLGSLGIRYGVIIGQQDEADETHIHKRWSIDVAAVLEKIGDLA
jgi:hypothetical protein